MSKTFVIQPNSSRNNFSLLLLIHVGFVFVGMVTTLLGVIMPALSGRLNLNDTQSGALFTLQFAGSLLGTLISGVLWKRFGFVTTLTAGLVIITGGIFGLGWLNWKGGAACIFLNGIGIGLTIPTSNLLIAELNHERQAGALNILNFAWGCGALLSPAFFGLLGTQQNIRLPLSILAGSMLLATLSFLSVGDVSIKAENLPTPVSPIDSPQIPVAQFAVLTAILLFLYVGVESSLGGWITAYSLRLEAAKTTLWTSAALAFWASFLLGRLLAPLGLRRVKESVYVLFCLMIAALGMLLLLSAQINLVTVGVILAGFGLAPVFPTVLAEFTVRLGKEGRQKANWLFVSGTFGGAFLTWLIGFLSNAFGSLRIGFSTVFFCCVLMILLQAYLYLKFRN